MQETHLFLLILVKVISGNPINPDCCASKRVGNESYTLVENPGVPVPEECLVPCVYSRDGQPGEFFCFKSGSLPVSCTEEVLVPVPGCAAEGGVSNELWDNAEGVLEFKKNTKIPACAAACTINPKCKGWSVDTNQDPPECILFDQPQNPQNKAGWCRSGTGSNTFQEEGTLEGPFGNLVSAKKNFTEKDKASAAITEILIFTGKFSTFENVVVGIQTTYGSSSAGPVRGREGNKTVCTADPKNGNYFSQIVGRALNNGDVNSFIYQLGFKNNAGQDLCVPPLSGIEQGDKFKAPEQPSQSMDIKYFEGATTDSDMLGSLSVFIDTISLEE